MIIVLTTWTKLFIALCSLGVVALTALFVVCFVNPVCLFHRLLPQSAQLQNKSIAKKSKRVSYDGLTLREPVELTKLTAVPQCDYGSPLSPVLVHDVGLKSPPYTSMYGHRRLYTNDSCYSSMSPTTEGGSRPTSPTSMVTDEADSLSLSSPPSISETEPSISYGSLNVELRYNLLEDSHTGHLVITLGEAHNLPGCEYHPTTCDPFIKVVLLKARTRLRKSRSHYMTLSEFQTSTVKKTRNPQFNQSFTIELTKTDIKDCALKYLVFDRDKFANPTAIAEAMLPLLDLKLQTTPDGIPLTVELQEPRQNNGEILIGLSYLPTSERLSINVIRAMNLKYETVTSSVDNLNVEVRILLLLNGKLVTKKKTRTVSNSNNPNFNQNISFDIPAVQLNNVVFVVGVAHRAEAVAESDDSLMEKPSRHDSFIGKVFLGSPIQSQSRSHWQAMLATLRQQVSSWHVLR